MTARAMSRWRFWTGVAHSGGAEARRAAVIRSTQRAHEPASSARRTRRIVRLSAVTGVLVKMKKVSARSGSRLMSSIWFRSITSVAQ